MKKFKNSVKNVNIFFTVVLVCAVSLIAVIIFSEMGFTITAEICAIILSFTAPAGALWLGFTTKV